jgi:hypothetical protein
MKPLVNSQPTHVDRQQYFIWQMANIIVTRFTSVYLNNSQLSPFWTLNSRLSWMIELWHYLPSVTLQPIWVWATFQPTVSPSVSLGVEPHIGLMTRCQSQSHITTDDQSVSASWFRAPFGAHDQMLITVWQLLFCRYRAPLLTIGRVCRLS